MHIMNLLINIFLSFPHPNLNCFFVLSLSGQQVSQGHNTIDV